MLKKSGDQEAQHEDKDLKLMVIKLAEWGLKKGLPIEGYKKPYQYESELEILDHCSRCIFYQLAEFLLPPDG
jgi:hypothetical protein